MFRVPFSAAAARRRFSRARTARLHIASVARPLDATAAVCFSTSARNTGSTSSQAGEQLGGGGDEAGVGFGAAVVGPAAL